MIKGMLKFSAVFIVAILCFNIYMSRDERAKNREENKLKAIKEEQDEASLKAQKEILNKELELDRKFKSWCLVFLKNSLNDPKNAEIESPLYNETKKITENIFEVTINGRFKNQFNALIKSSFKCKAKKISDDNWELVSLEKVAL